MKTTVLVASALLSVANAFWRMPCHGRTGLDRIDPLVDPDEISDHSHAIHGGSNFGFSTTYDDLRASECTSCGVYQDLSAYWTPPMYFVYPNGTTVLVPQVGGMLAYYLLYGDNVTAFPRDFRLLAGDTRLRNFTGPVPDIPKSLWTGNETTQFALSQKALGFNCLNYGAAAEPSLYRHFMPDKDYLDANCPQGLRLELMFPSCWNGKDVDSKDHKSHMAYPSTVMDGTCPPGFETRLPSLFYETIWNTYAFVGQEGQFVLGNGDPTGCGYHGDFINGWDVGFLQSAVDTCTNLSGEVSDCKLFDLQDDDEALQCTFKQPSQLKHDDCAGPRDGLCGGVPIQSGPAYASKLTAGLTVQPTATSKPKTTHKTYGGGHSSKSTARPSLGYSEGTSVAADNSGGGITVAEAPSGNTPAATTSSTSSSSSSTSSKSPAQPTGYEPTVNAVAAPSPSPTPSPQPSDVGDPNAVSTSIWTSGGAAYELYIEEVDVTTTVTATANSMRRRHMHHHRRNHHGGLGGTFW